MYAARSIRTLEIGVPNRNSFVYGFKIILQNYLLLGVA